jgi:hypothetical protein
MAAFSPEYKGILVGFRCPNGHAGHLEYNEGAGTVVKLKLSEFPFSSLTKGLFSPGAHVNSYKVLTGSGFRVTKFREDSSFSCDKCGGNWPVFSDTGQIVILNAIDTRRTATPMGYDDYARDNRSSSIPMNSTIKVSRRWLQRLEVDWEESRTTSTTGKVNLLSQYASVGLERKVEQSLKSSLSLVTEAEQLTEQSVEVVVPAHRRLTVRLNWKQIWQEGRLEVRLPDGTSAEIAYRAAVDVTFDQENIEG